jgi:hypothetical protein
MSDMGFSYNGYPPQDDPAQTQEPDPSKAPGWYRDKMEKDSKALADMRAEIDALRAESRQSKVTQELVARGYAPGAAALYNGDPDKVEDWLTANAAYLVKTEPQSYAQQTAQGGAPASTVSTNSQETQQRMNAAGVDGNGQVLSGDDAIAAALRATNTPEEFQQVARAHGWNYDMLS